MPDHCFKYKVVAPTCTRVGRALNGNPNVRTVHESAKRWQTLSKYVVRLAASRRMLRWKRDEDNRRNLACPNRQCRVPVGIDAKSWAACSFEEQTGLSEWALRRISLVFGIWIVVMQGALGGLGFVHHVRRHWVVETSTHLRQWAMASSSTRRARVRPWGVRGGEAPREIIHMMA